MVMDKLQGWVASPSPRNPVDVAGYAVIAALGVLLFWLSENHPAMGLIWVPWDFSPTVYLTTALTLFWFFRGLLLTAPDARPPAWRRALFLLGVAVIYGVLQTRFEYWSQHMFFLNRIQHVVMHHIGPFLVALGWVGATIKTGMPNWAKRLIELRAVTITLRIVQQPVIAVFLFVGTFFLWLIPDVHFRAMIDPRLYAVMNWTMVVEGLLFWALVLDPRPKPPARVGFGTRAVLAVVVMFPQIILGAVIALWQHDLYPYYEICGRIFPSISALNDQHIGGVIIWIPPAMMSVIGALMVLVALRLHEESQEETDEDASYLAALASRWTGR